MGKGAAGRAVMLEVHQAARCRRMVEELRSLGYEVTEPAGTEHVLTVNQRDVLAVFAEAGRRMVDRATVRAQVDLARKCRGQGRIIPASLDSAIRALVLRGQLVRVQRSVYRLAE